MLQVGDTVKYRDITGTIVSINDDMAIVKLADGKEYALPYSSLTKDGGSVMPPAEFAGIMIALKPHLKDMNFLNDLAKEMSRAGVSELSIRNGSIAVFHAKESYEEKLAKHRAVALADAEKRAKEEFEKENKAS